MVAQEVAKQAVIVVVILQRNKRSEKQNDFCIKRTQS